MNLPQPIPCNNENDCECHDCCEPSQRTVEIPIKKVCAATSSDSLPPLDECNKTYDSIVNNAVVPPVGENFTINVADICPYTVGEWIEFITPTGAKYQIISKQVPNQLVLKNSDSTGLIAVDGNPAVGQTINYGSSFVVIGSPNRSISTADFQNFFKKAPSLCLSADTSAIEENESAALIGVVEQGESSETQCNDYSEAGYCLRRNVNGAPRVDNRTILFPNPQLKTPTKNNLLWPMLDTETNKIVFMDLFGDLQDGKCYNICLDASGRPKFTQYVPGSGGGEEDVWPKVHVLNSGIPDNRNEWIQVSSKFTATIPKTAPIPSIKFSQNKVRVVIELEMKPLDSAVTLQEGDGIFTTKWGKSGSANLLSFGIGSGQVGPEGENSPVVRSVEQSASYIPTSNGDIVIEIEFKGVYTDVGNDKDFMLTSRGGIRLIEFE